MDNKTLFKKASKYIPGGVNSPVRAFKAVGGDPVFIKKAKGAFIYDEAGKKYLDFCAAWGPMFFGHAPSGLVKSIQKAAEGGTAFGTATHEEIDLAQKICKFFPSIEKVRLVNSGTEAVMSAIRLARGFTGRPKIVKLDGGYHGHADSLLIQAGSGATTLGTPDSAGVPKAFAELTLSIPFNDTEALERTFKKHGKSIAAFILEPVPANMGVVLPGKSYLKKVRTITKKYGTLLIFDEVMTGFRTTKTGAQGHFGIVPDITTLGKIVGGGMPLAALGGRSEIMDCLAPVGPVYQAGTLSGNPVAVAAALWMLENLEKEKPHQKLNKKCERFYSELQDYIDENKIPVRLNFIGSMFTIFLTKQKVFDYESAKTSDLEKFAAFFREALNEGIYLAPSQFESNFISTVHTDAQLRRTAKIFKKILSDLYT